MRSKADVDRFNLQHGIENKNRKNNEEKLRTKTDRPVLRSNGPVKSPWSQFCGRKSLWREGFVKLVGFEPGVVDDESSESTEEEKTGADKSEPAIKKLVRGCPKETGS